MSLHGVLSTNGIRYSEVTWLNLPSGTAAHTAVSGQFHAYRHMVAYNEHTGWVSWTPHTSPLQRLNSRNKNLCWCTRFFVYSHTEFLVLWVGRKIFLPLFEIHCFSIVPSTISGGCLNCKMSSFTYNMLACLKYTVAYIMLE